MSLRDILRYKGWYTDPDPMSRWEKFVQMSRDDEWYNSLDADDQELVQQQAIYGEFRPIAGPEPTTGVEKYAGWAFPAESPQEKFFGTYFPEAGRSALAAVEFPVRTPVNLAARASEALVGGDPVTQFLSQIVNAPIDYSRGLTEDRGYGRFEGGADTAASFLANMAVWAPTLGAGLLGGLPAGAGAAVPGVAGLHWGTRALAPLLARTGMAPEAAQGLASFLAMTAMPAVEQISEGVPVAEAAWTLPMGAAMGGAFAGLHRLGLPYLGRVAGAGALGAGAAAVEGGGPLEALRGGIEFGLLEAGMNPYNALREEAVARRTAAQREGPIDFTDEESAFRFIQQLEPEFAEGLIKEVRVNGKEMSPESITALRAGLGGRPDDILAQYDILARDFGPDLQNMGEGSERILAQVEQARAAKSGEALPFDKATEAVAALRQQREQAAAAEGERLRAQVEAEEAGIRGVEEGARLPQVPALPAVTETRRAQVEAQDVARRQRAESEQRDLDQLTYAGSLYERYRAGGMSDEAIRGQLRSQFPNTPKGQKQADATFEWMKRASERLGLGKGGRTPEEIQRELDFEAQQREGREARVEEEARTTGRPREEIAAELAQAERARGDLQWRAEQRGRTVTEGIEEALTIGLPQGKSRELTAQELAKELGRSVREVQAILKNFGDRFEVRETQTGTQRYALRGTERTREQQRPWRKRNRAEQQELPLLYPNEPEPAAEGRVKEILPVRAAAQPGPSAPQVTPRPTVGREQVAASLRGAAGEKGVRKEAVTRTVTDQQLSDLTQTVEPRRLKALGIGVEVTEGGATLRGSQKAFDAVAGLVERGGEARERAEGLRVEIPKQVGEKLREAYRSLRGLKVEDVPGKPGRMVATGDSTALDKAAAHLNSVPRGSVSKGVSSLLSKVSGDLSRASRAARTATPEQVAGARRAVAKPSAVGRRKEVPLLREQARPPEPVVEKPEAAPVPAKPAPAKPAAEPPVETKPAPTSERVPYWKELTGKAAAAAKKGKPVEKAQAAGEAKKEAPSKEEVKEEAKKKPSQAQVLLELRRRFPGAFKKVRFEKNGDMTIETTGGKTLVVRPEAEITLERGKAAGSIDIAKVASKGAVVPGTTTYLSGIDLLRITERGIYDSTPNHEMLHISRDLGLITEAEWRLLKSRFAKGMTEAELDKATKAYMAEYGMSENTARELVYEEQVAYGIENARKAYKTTAKDFWRDRLREMGNWLKERKLMAGTRHVVGDHVIRTIRTGEILSRVTENPQLMADMTPQQRQDIQDYGKIGAVEKYSIRTLDAQEQALIRRAKESNIPEEEVRRWLIDARTVGETLKVYKDMLPKPVGGTPIRDNAGGYGSSMDFDTLCPRSTAYYAAIHNVEKYMERALSGDERIALTQAMRDKGLLTRCVQCFTENGRDQLANSRIKWAKERGMPTAAIDDTLAAREWIGKSKSRQEAYDWIMAQNAGISNKVKGYSEYDHNLLRIGGRKAEEFRRGFLRWFSNSDFKAEHMVDAMQAMVDMQFMRFKGLAYTKQESFISVFHKTGMKINASVAGIWDPETRTMKPDLDAGMDWDAARKWMKKSPDVGVAFLAKNPEQVDWAMKQGWIQNVLLFRKSGFWSDSTMRALGVPDAESYVNMAASTAEYAAVVEKYKGHPDFIKIQSDNPRRDTQFRPVKADFDMAAAAKVIDSWAKQGGSKMKIPQTLVRELAASVEKLPERKAAAERPVEKAAVRGEEEEGRPKLELIKGEGKGAGQRYNDLVMELEELHEKFREAVSKPDPDRMAFYDRQITATRKKLDEENGRRGLHLIVEKLRLIPKDMDAKGFYDEMEDVGLREVLSEFRAAMQSGLPVNGRQGWNVIPAARVIRAWNDYAKYGEAGLERHAEALDQMAQQVVRNIFRLNANTLLAGYGEMRNYEKRKEFVKQVIRKYDAGDLELEDGFKFLDYVTIPVAASRIQGEFEFPRTTDTALTGVLLGQIRGREGKGSPASLLDRAYDIAIADTPAEQLAAIDKVFNITHPRTDLAEWIVEGGKETLDKLAGAESRKFIGDRPEMDPQVFARHAREMEDAAQVQLAQVRERVEEKEGEQRLTENDPEKLAGRGQDFSAGGFTFKNRSGGLKTKGNLEYLVTGPNGERLGITGRGRDKVAQIGGGSFTTLWSYMGVKASSVNGLVQLIKNHLQRVASGEMLGMTAEERAAAQRTLDSLKLQSEARLRLTGRKKEIPVEKAAIRPRELGKKFVDQDVVPAVREAIGTITKITRDLVDLAAPAMRADSAMLDRVHEALGKRYHTEFVLDVHIDEARRRIDKMDRAGQKQVYAELESTNRSADPVVREFEDYSRSILDHLWAEAKKRRRGVKAAIANYFPHRWKKLPNAPATAAENRTPKGNRPYEGTMQYFKERSIETIAEGIRLGGEPESWNAAEMLMSHVNDITKFITAYDMLESFKGSGVAKLVRKHRQAPEGWRALDSRQSRLLAGPLPFAKIYLTPDAHRILNNYLSRDLIRESSLGRGLMGLKNLTTQIELGISGFHATFEAAELVGSQVGLGLRKMLNTRDFIGGAADILKAPLAPYATYKLGKAVERYIANPQQFSQLPEIQWLRSKVPDVDLFVRDLFTSGARLRVDESYKTAWIKGFRGAMKEGNYIGALARGPMAAMEGSMRWLFENLIPRWKTGLWAKEYVQTLAERSADLASGQVTREKLARDVWKFTEDRLGEMNFDSLFWNRTFKSALQMMFRSVTWKLGNLRGFGKVVPREAKAIKDYIRNRENPVLDQNLAWLFGMSVITATFGTIAQKMLTGKDPGEDGEGLGDTLKDLVFPRFDKDDDTQRLNTPTYWKDALHLIHSPTKYVRSSMSGVMSRGLEIWANQDFYGQQIAEKTDNEAEAVWKYFAHLFPLPISIQSFVRLTEAGRPELGAASFAGITKAPGYISLTDAQRLMREITGEKEARGGRTAEQVEKSQQRYEAVVALRKGKQVQKPPLLSEQEWKRVLKDVGEDPDLLRIKRLTVPEVARVWNEATEKERKAWRGAFLKKLDNLARTGPPQATMKKLREAYRAAVKYDEVRWH